MAQTFEQMQFSNEVNQGQDFDSTDHSKVDKYKTYNYDCGSYEHKYSHLAPETHDEADN
jgi:hypothetical protein